jgi:hypothetical protein
MKEFGQFKFSWLLVLAIFTLFLPLRGQAQSHSGFPVDIATSPAPQPVEADGRLRLLYELHLTNVAPIPIEVVALELFGDDDKVPLANYKVLSAGHSRLARAGKSSPLASAARSSLQATIRRSSNSL